VEYLVNKCPVRELRDVSATQVVIDNVLHNEHFSNRIPEGVVPAALTFIVENSAQGKRLYGESNGYYGDEAVFVGVELTSGY